MGGNGDLLFPPIEGTHMNLLSVLDSTWFSFCMGALFIFFAFVRARKQRDGIAGWVGPIVFTLCALVFFYNGVLKLHRG